MEAQTGHGLAGAVGQLEDGLAAHGGAGPGEGVLQGHLPVVAVQHQVGAVDLARLTDHRLVDLDAGLAAGCPADLEGQVHQGPAGILLEGGHAGEGVFDRTALPIHLADRGGQPVVVAGIQQGHILGIEAQLKLELLEVLVVRGVDDVVEGAARSSLLVGGTGLL